MIFVIYIKKTQKNMFMGTIPNSNPKFIWILLFRRGKWIFHFQLDKQEQFVVQIIHCLRTQPNIGNGQGSKPAHYEKEKKRKDKKK